MLYYIRTSHKGIKQDNMDNVVDFPEKEGVPNESIAR